MVNITFGDSSGDNIILESKPVNDPVENPMKESSDISTFLPIPRFQRPQSQPSQPRSSYPIIKPSSESFAEPSQSPERLPKIPNKLPEIPNKSAKSKITKIRPPTSPPGSPMRSPRTLPRAALAEPKVRNIPHEFKRSISDLASSGPISTLVSTNTPRPFLPNL